MEIGQRVRIKESHYLAEIFTGVCEILKIKPMYSTEKYLIRTLGEEKNLVWVYENELMEISELRNKNLEQLGI